MSFRYSYYIIFVFVCSILYCSLLGRYEGVSYGKEEVSYVELMINGTFDNTIINEKNDIEMLLDSINSSKPAFPTIGLPSGGFTMYCIRLYFQDNSYEDFEFISCGNKYTNYTSKTSKMVKVPERIGGTFKGDLEFIFFEMIKKNNPTERNLEWYNSFWRKQHHTSEVKHKSSPSENGYGVPALQSLSSYNSA